MKISNLPNQKRNEEKKMIRHCTRCGRILTEEEKEHDLCEECQYYGIAERISPSDMSDLTEREHELITKHFKKKDKNYTYLI